MIPGQVGSIHVLAENPGEYEVKILRTQAGEIVEVYSRARWS